MIRSKSVGSKLTALGRSDDRVVNILVDTADAGFTVGHADLDVTVVAPGSVPRVANDIVALLTLVTVANSDDSVIDAVRATISLSDNTTLVVPEDVVASGDGDVDGANLDGSLDGIGVRLDLLVGAHVSDTLGFIVCALSLLAGSARSVGVVGLRHGLFVLEPLVGVVVPAAAAAVAREHTLGAVNKLLRGHDDLLVAGNDVGRLDGLGR